MVDLLAAEYGYTERQIKEMTRREVGERIAAISNRRSGYKESQEVVNVEIDEEAEKKLKRAIERRLNERRNSN